MNTINNFDALLEASKRPIEAKEVKSLGGKSMNFRHLSAEERDSYEASFINNKGEVDGTKLRGVRQRLVALCICDEEGNKIADDKKLAKLPAEVIDELAEIAQAMNGMDPKAKEEAGNA